MERFAKFDCDLYAIGYSDKPNAKILEYHAKPVPGPGVVRLQDTFLDENVPDSKASDPYLPYTSSLTSGLASHLRAFYAANPGYSGGKFIHLRINPNLHKPAGSAFFRIRMANDSARAPELRLAWEAPSLQSWAFDLKDGPENLYLGLDGDFSYQLKLVSAEAQRFHRIRMSYR